MKEILAYHKLGGIDQRHAGTVPMQNYAGCLPGVTARSDVKQSPVPAQPIAGSANGPALTMWCN
jgi:hypothetical protein